MLTAAARTHVGRVRSGNEDALVCRPAEGLFAVIDGMGGEAAGEVAAAIAAESLGAVPGTRRHSGAAVLTAALRAARARILAEAARDANLARMGAVATAVRVDDDGRHVTVAHVGDTRAYRVDRAGVSQLTRDHVAEANGPGKKPAVARDLGRADLPEPWVDTTRAAVHPGDLLVLCTDGLYDPVSAEELTAELTQLWSSAAPVDEAANRLVGLALARGGPDNVTVVVIRIGRFRRRGRMRRLGAPAAIALLGLVGAMALVAGFWRSRHLPPIPDEIRHSKTVTEPALLVLPSGAHTRVAAGQTLTLRGVTVSADGWTVNLGDGATLDLRLSAVTIEGPLTVAMGNGAHLVLEDARLSAGTVVITGFGSARCADSLLRSETGNWTVDPAVALEVDGCRIGARGDPETRLLAPPAAGDAPSGAPAGDAPPAAPAGDAPPAAEAAPAP